MIENFYKFLDFISEWMGMIFTVGMVLVIFIQIIWRYCFNSPLSWPEETARYLFLWSTYIAIAVCMKGDGHLRVTILPDMVSEHLKKLINLFCQLINMAFFFLAIVLSIDMTIEVEDLEQMAISLQMPMWIIWAGIPVFCSFVFLQSVRNFYLIWTDRLTAGEK